MRRGTPQPAAPCQGLDERVEIFPNRTLTGPFPYVWLEAKYLKVREGGRVLSMALVIATGVNTQGDREVRGGDVGPSEDADFWTPCLRGLLDRGLTGVPRVISDAHRGLQQAIQAVFQGASWQRCRVHALRNLLATVPKSAQALGAALVRPIVVHPDKRAALVQLAEVAETLPSRFPQAATALRDRADDLLAFMSFPAEHWRQIASTNPLERLNRAMGRRTDVVGIFPHRTAALRLAGAVLMEPHEWLAAPRRDFSHESMAKLGGGSSPTPAVDTPAALMAPSRRCRARGSPFPPRPGTLSWREPRVPRDVLSRVGRSNGMPGAVLRSQDELAAKVNRRIFVRGSVIGAGRGGLD
jgi:putative transposase